MENKIQILCTRPVDQEMLQTAANNDLHIDTISFIHTERIENVEVQQEIENALILSANVVFTSMNAVEAVSEHLFEEKPDWNIYCIGNTTRKLAEKFFGEEKIKGFASDASLLAESITMEDDINDVIFFCGNKRRDELPQILLRAGIGVDEIIVYETIAVQHKVEKNYHGILFFSPSAVESFFSNNSIPEQTVFFAIGQTTASTIKKYTSNEIIVASEPGKNGLVEKVVEYFT